MLVGWPAPSPKSGTRNRRPHCTTRHHERQRSTTPQTLTSYPLTADGPARWRSSRKRTGPIRGLGSWFRHRGRERIARGSRHVCPRPGWRLPTTRSATARTGDCATLADILQRAHHVIVQASCSRQTAGGEERDLGVVQVGQAVERRSIADRPAAPCPGSTETPSRPLTAACWPGERGRSYRRCARADGYGSNESVARLAIDAGRRNHQRHAPVGRQRELLGGNPDQELAPPARHGPSARPALARSKSGRTRLPKAPHRG